MPQLPNAARRVPKATYVPLQIASTSVGSTTQHPDGSDTTQPNAAILKFGYIRQLNLQGGDVAKAMAAMQTTTATDLPSGINATDIPSILSQF